MLSQNGYPVLETNRTTGPIPRLRKWHVPGANRHVFLRDGSVGFVLVHMALWFHESIERIDVGVWDDWGWAVRPVRGQTSGYSNHAAGAAADLNAVLHPRGRSLETFRLVGQVVRIRAQLASYRGVVGWGGNYQHSPIDGMHFEIVKPMLATQDLARRLATTPRGRRILLANPGAADVIFDGKIPVNLFGKPVAKPVAPVPKPAAKPVAPVPKPAAKPVAPVPKPAAKPAPERLAIDYSYAKPHPTAIKAAGYRGVIRYLSSKSAKNINAAEAAALHKAGLWIALVFEETARRAGAGLVAGRVDAAFAERSADRLGYPKNAVIFYAVDYDATPRVVVNYFKGIRQVAKRPVGIYGSYQIIEADLAPWKWQTTAWSDGKVSKRANWLQRTSHSHTIVGSKASDWDEDLLIRGNVPVWSPEQPVVTPRPVIAPPVVSPVEVAPLDPPFVPEPVIPPPVLFDIIQANLFKDNPEKALDISLLAATGAELISLNEAFRFRTLLKGLDGYQTVQIGTEDFMLNNAILVRDGIKVIGFEARQMCEKTGAAPRSGTVVKYELDGHKRAHVCTHLNAHIQSGGVPTDLPRTREAIRHMIRLEAWVKELVAEGYLVTVAGDFNWAWTADDTHDWAYSPETVFARLGMALAFDDPTMPHHGTLGTRRIDYVCYFPADLTILSQHLIPGEHSDHAWVFVETQIGG